jgi:hypothetical protein
MRLDQELYQSLVGGAPSDSDYAFAIHDTWKRRSKSWLQAIGRKLKEEGGGALNVWNMNRGKNLSNESRLIYVSLENRTLFIRMNLEEGVLYSVDDKEWLPIYPELIGEGRALALFRRSLGWS